MRASDAWIEKLAMFISRRCDLFRCLPKMLPSSSTSTGSQIAIWRRSFTWTHHDFDHCWRERCSSDYRRFSLNPVQRDILPHRQSQLSDLTIRLYIMTSLKSISQKRWLYHQIFKMVHLTSLSMSITWPIVPPPHWSHRVQLIYLYDKS